MEDKPKLGRLGEIIGRYQDAGFRGPEIIEKYHKIRDRRLSETSLEEMEKLVRFYQADEYRTIMAFENGGHSRDLFIRYGVCYDEIFRELDEYVDDKIEKVGKRAKKKST